MINKKQLLTMFILYWTGIIILFIIFYIFNIALPHQFMKQDLKISIFDLVVHNLFQAGIMISGIFLLGIPTLVNLVINIIIFALAIRSSLKYNALYSVFLALAPHAITESVGIALSSYIGIQGLSFYKQNNSKKKEILIINLKIIVFYIVPVFIISGILEILVSKHLG